MRIGYSVERRKPTADDHLTTGCQGHGGNEIAAQTEDAAVRLERAVERAIRVEPGNAVGGETIVTAETAGDDGLVVRLHGDGIDFTVHPGMHEVGW